MIFFIAIESFTGNHEEKIGLPHRSATSVCHNGRGSDTTDPRYRGPTIRYGYRRNNPQNPANR